jgi:acetylglutamate kinase
MAITDMARAEVLAQAFPYIERYKGKTIVVKYGGAAMVNENVREAVVQDLLLMSSVGIRTVLVHGGGPEIDSFLRKVGKEPQFIGGLRYTDEETMDVVQMVLAGRVNKQLVALIQRGGGSAIGLCGADGGLLTARRLEGPVDLGLVGEITRVDPRVLATALDASFIPVVATVAMGGIDDDTFYNVNADTAAAELALALRAEKLILLTDVPGLLRDPHDAGTLIAELPRGEVAALVASGIVSRGMIPKVECCAKAVTGGVGRAHIIDGRSPHSLLLEVFSDGGIGTMIV